MTKMANGTMSSPSTREESSVVQDLKDPKIQADPKDPKIQDRKEFKTVIVWNNVAKFVVLHVLGLHALVLFPAVAPQTVAFSVLCSLLGGLGVTAGAHRLWTHRSYKARLPLRVFLMLINCLAMENSIYVWTRDHRVHHKFSETSADPHDATRGLFFSHMGWLMVRKHPDVKEKGSKIDLSDLQNDPVVMFQHRHYLPLAMTLCIVLPTLIPIYFWGEHPWTSYVWSILSYLVTLHGTWSVNSLAHMFGSRPYDVNINPSENKFVSFVAIGEGFHNYHHTYPHDYSASEYRWSLNLTTLFIDTMAWCGMAYDRRSVSKEAVSERIKRTGPGSQLVAAKPSTDVYY